MRLNLQGSLRRGGGSLLGFALGSLLRVLLRLRRLARESLRFLLGGALRGLCFALGFEALLLGFTLPRFGFLHRFARGFEAFLLFRLDARALYRFKSCLLLCFGLRGLECLEAHLLLGLEA